MLRGAAPAALASVQFLNLVTDAEGKVDSTGTGSLTFCVGEGAGVAGLGIVTPLFQTNLEPDLTQVNFFPPEIEVAPAFVHFEPALTAATAEAPASRSEQMIKGATKPVVQQTKIVHIEVPGSKGNKYHVTNESGRWTCTCAGFQFRRQCKHTQNASVV